MASLASPKCNQLILAALLGLSLTGCKGVSQSFVGFTFGGGGNTFSCEPAVWLPNGAGFHLRAGQPGSATSIELKGDGTLKPREPSTLASATITVPDHSGPATLVSGNLVEQSSDGVVVNGSFDLKVKTADGREFPVIGSYTASIEKKP